MSTFTDCADNLTCATLSGSNGIGVALAVGSPNKIVVSASNVPNSALANSSININGTTIALGASGSITVGGGTVTSVTAGTNLSASGTSTDPVLNLTGNITSGLTSITGLTNISSNAVTGTNIFATDINTTTLTGSVSGTSAQFTNLTASHISSSTLTGSVSGASGQFITLTGSNIYSNTVTGSISGTSGQFGSATINTLNSTNISATTVSGAFSGSGALIDDITASHIYHFQEDVRSQFTEGTGISILLGQISVTNVPNSSLANSGSTIGSTAVVLGTTVPSLTGLTNLSSTAITGTTGISSSLGTFTILTASNEKVLTSLSASQITASSISSSNYIGLTGSSANFPNFASDVRAQFTAGSNIGISAGGVISLSSSVSTTAVTGTTGISGALGLFTTLTGTNVTGATVQFTTLSASNGKILTSLSASQITASSISSSNYIGLSATSPVQYSNNVISLDGTAFTSSVGGAVTVATPLTKSGTTVGIQEASNTLVGVVNTGAQTFAGIKTFNSVITASGGITGSSTAQFTTVSGTFVSGSQLSGTNAKILTSLSASQITASFISGTQVTGSNISGTNNLYIGNRIGIGTISPSTTLDVNGQQTIRGTRLYHSSSNYQTEFGPSAGTGKTDWYGIYAPSGKGIALFSNAGGERVYISSSNVGIGTENPNEKLEINSSGHAAIAITSNNNSASIYADGNDGGTGQLTLSTDANNNGTKPLIITNIATQDGVAFGESSKGDNVLFQDGTKLNTAVSHGSFMIDKYSFSSPNRNFFSSSLKNTNIKILTTNLGSQTFTDSLSSSNSIINFDYYIPFSLSSSLEGNTVTASFIAELSGSNGSISGSFSPFDGYASGLIYLYPSTVQQTITSLNTGVSVTSSLNVALGSNITRLFIIDIKGYITANKLAGDVYLNIYTNLSATNSPKIYIYPGCWVRASRVDGYNNNVIDGAIYG